MRSNIWFPISSTFLWKVGQRTSELRAPHLLLFEAFNTFTLKGQDSPAFKTLYLNIRKIFDLLVI